MVGSMESDDDITQKIDRSARTLAGRQRFVTIAEAVDRVMNRLRRQVLPEGGGKKPAAALAARETPGLEPGRASEDR